MRNQVFRTRLALVEDREFPLRLPMPARLPTTPVQVELLSHTSVYRADFDRVRRLDDAVALPIPQKLLRLQHRAAPRVGAPAGTMLSFLDPREPRSRVVCPIRDVSRDGVGFYTRTAEDHLPPSLLLEDLTVRFPNGGEMRFSGRVRAAPPGRDGEFGARVFPSTQDDAARWHDRVGHLLIPSTQVGGTWSEHLWDLYEDSGYFSLSGKSPPHFKQLREPFANVLRKLDAAPHLGCQVVWPSERGVEAGLALLKIYSASWFAYQLAKRPGDPPGGVPGKAVLRSVHMRAYEHAQLDPELRWIVALVQDSARWSKLVYYDLPARYVDTGLAAVVPVQVYEVDQHEPYRARESRWSVADATRREISDFLAFIARKRPPAYLEALDYLPASFDLAATHEVWRGAGLSRERSVQVAHRGERPVAVAVLESADPGLHLFGLLDLVRIFEIEPGGAAAYTALIDRARSWYQRRGRTSFTCIVEEGQIPMRPDLRDLGHASLTIFSTDLLASFLEHILEVTAPRQGE